MQKANTIELSLYSNSDFSITRCHGGCNGKFYTFLRNVRKKPKVSVLSVGLQLVPEWQKLKVWKLFLFFKLVVLYSYQLNFFLSRSQYKTFSMGWNIRLSKSLILLHAVDFSWNAKVRMCWYSWHTSIFKVLCLQPYTLQLSLKVSTNRFSRKENYLFSKLTKLVFHNEFKILKNWKSQSR